MAKSYCGNNPSVNNLTIFDSSLYTRGALGTERAGQANACMTRFGGSKLTPYCVVSDIAVGRGLAPAVFICGWPGDKKLFAKKKDYLPRCRYKMERNSPAEGVLGRG